MLNIGGFPPPKIADSFHFEYNIFGYDLAEFGAISVAAARVCFRVPSFLSSLPIYVQGS
jgi:hypothetical protein